MYRGHLGCCGDCDRAWRRRGKASRDGDADLCSCGLEANNRVGISRRLRWERLILPGRPAARETSRRTGVWLDAAELCTELQGKKGPFLYLLYRASLTSPTISLSSPDSPAHVVTCAYRTPHISSHHRPSRWSRASEPCVSPRSLRPTRYKTKTRRPTAHTSPAQHPPPVTAVAPPLRTNRVSPGSKPPSAAFSSYTAHSGVGAQ